MSNANPAYPVQVSYTQQFVRGVLKGITYNNTMGFCSWKDAYAWAEGCNRNRSCEFVVTELKEQVADDLPGKWALWCVDYCLRQRAGTLAIQRGLV